MELLQSRGMYHCARSCITQETRPQILKMADVSDLGTCYLPSSLALLLLAPQESKLRRKRKKAMYHSLESIPLPKSKKQKMLQVKWRSGNY